MRGRLRIIGTHHHNNTAMKSETDQTARWRDWGGGRGCAL